MAEYSIAEFSGCAPEESAARKRQTILKCVVEGVKASETPTVPKI